tara:strand:+ start:211 stop:489 length:279 start_codon:yes stop_codon:yes gene_type:complete
MEDGRKNNGGHKNGGRKSKSDEQKLIEKLSPLETTAHTALKNAIEDGESWGVKMYFEYMYGKPKQAIEVASKEGNELMFKMLVVDSNGNKDK